MTYRICTYPGCRATTDQRRCSAHRNVSDGLRRKTADRGYGGEWRKLRRLHLASEPLCRHCRTRKLIVVAVDVDHIIPLSRGGTNSLDNLQSLCHSCHARKTRAENG